MLQLIGLILELGVNNECVYMSFEQSNCLDAVENLQHEQSERVYCLARSIIKAYNRPDEVQVTSWSNGPGNFFI